MLFYSIPFNPFMNNYNMFGFSSMFQSWLNPQNYFLNQYYNAFNIASQQNNSIFQVNREHTTYNKAKADLLLKNAKEGLPKNEPDPALCARYVKNAIVKSGLGEYVNGNGEQTKYILRNNLNFYEVPVKSEKDFKNLPKGTAIVYDANDKVKYSNGREHYMSKEGHVGFKLDNKTMISDRIEEMPVSTKAYAFIPV